MINIRYKKDILEYTLYLAILTLILYWRKEEIFSFLLNEQFLNTLISSAVTLSSIGIALLGILFVLPKREGLRGETAEKIRKNFFSLLKKCTAFFLLSSVLAFLSISFLASMSSSPEVISIAATACSALSTILFLSGLLYLLYVSLKIEEAGT